VPVQGYAFFCYEEDRQFTYKLKLRHVRANIVAVKNNKDYIFCVCVCVFVALGTQHAIRLRRTVFCGLTACTIFFRIV